MLCSSSRLSPKFFTCGFGLKRHMRVTSTTYVIKLLFEFMQKLFLCSLVFGVTLSTSLPPRLTILVPTKFKLLSEASPG